MVKYVGKLPTDVNIVRQLNSWNFNYEIFHTNLAELQSKAFLVCLCIKKVHQPSFSLEETRKRLKRAAAKEDKDDIRETTESLSDAKEISADFVWTGVYFNIKRRTENRKKSFLGGSVGS